MTVYDVQIIQGPWLSGFSCGFGINESGFFVGCVETAEVLSPTAVQAIWLPDQPPIVPFLSDIPTDNIWGGVLVKINSSGYAVGQVTNGGPSWPAVVNGTSLIVDLRSLGNGIVASDINNQWTVVGTEGSSQDTDEPGIGFGPRVFIYTFFPIPGKKIWLSPLPNSTGIQAEAINDLGDVVGGCDSGAGFFYSASTKTMTGIDSCYLNDINMNRLAVGFDSGNPHKPIMVDLSQANPAVQSIPVPAGFAEAEARAINSSNTIVGYSAPQDPQPGWPPWGYAFVYSNGSFHNLNDLLSAANSYYLIDAMDINDLGQIVGTAFGNGRLCAYVATPHVVFAHWPVAWWPWTWGSIPWNWTWPPYSNPLSPQIITAALREQASRMPITGKTPSPRQLQKMLDAHRAQVFHSSVARRKDESRRRTARRRRKRKA
jgi:hypothetical protein